MASNMNKLALDRHLPAVYTPPKPQRRYAPGRAPIVPPGSVTGKSLIMVIGIMAFLACLTTGIVYMINRMATEWQRKVAGEVTVLVEPEGSNADIEKHAGDIVKFLTGQIGVRDVKALTAEQSAELVEPWLGQIPAVKDLPFPRLIAVTIDGANPPDMTALRGALTSKFSGASLDDHRAWQQQIRRVTSSLALGGFALIALVAAATIGIVVSAARSAMSSNKDIIEVLNFVGAEERFIARQFELHFLKVGIKAGAAGALAAASVFFFMPIAADFMSGSGAQAEFRRLFGSGKLDLYGYASLLLVVVAIAAICQITSRYGVRHILNAQNQ
jgi:cell division transport system permease protein